MKSYVASPFFTESQVEVVKNITNQLEVFSEVYSPFRDGTKVTSVMSNKVMKNVYLGDMGAIIDSNVIFGVLDYDDLNINYDENEIKKDRVFHGFDSGTIWEIGLSKGLGKRILMYIPPHTKLNLMLTMNADGYTTDINKCGELFEDIIIKNNKFIKEKYVKMEKSEDKGKVYL